MGVCCNPCSYEVLKERNKDGSQKGAVQTQTRRRSWCRCCTFLFLLLVGILMVAFIDIPSNLTQIPLTWRMNDYGEHTTDSIYVEYPHEYHFIVDEPKKCQANEPFLVLMVPVAPYNRAARDAIRSTWGTEGMVLGKVVSLFFLLALPSGAGAERLQEQVLQESKEHGDLLQSDFKDSYKNLTIKTMVMLEWLSSRCPNASYAMKIDSDMFLNVHNLVNLLLTAPQHNYMTGQVTKWATVQRNPNSKWYLPKTVFPGLFYPPYALGLGYVMSLDLPRKLVKASRHVKAVYIEDVYLGLCMKHLGIQPSYPPTDDLFQGYQLSTMSSCYYSSVITTILETPQQLLDIWEHLKKNGIDC